MMKYCFYLPLLLCVCLLTGCSVNDTSASHTNAIKEKTADEKPEKEEITEQLIMVNGELYYNTGQNDQNTLRCGMMYGTIDSAVAQNKIPEKDNQSNFGTDIAYQIGDHEVELSMDGGWFLFKPWTQKP